MLSLCKTREIAVVLCLCFLYKPESSYLLQVSNSALLGRSLFERLSLLGHKKHLLNMQYRMHPSISIFPNFSFYDKKILDGPNVTQSGHERGYLPGAMFGPYTFINIDSSEDRGRSKRNMAEVAAILEILQSLKQGAYNLHMHGLKS